jgi:hypothetical protein
VPSQPSARAVGTLLASLPYLATDRAHARELQAEEEGRGGAREETEE